MKIAITGSNGYIGSYLVSYLKAQQHSIVEMSRKSSSPSSEQFIYFDLGQTHLQGSLNTIDVLIHCAYDFSHTNYLDSRKVNVGGTLELFKQARAQGVKKIIYLSSVSAFAQAVSHYGRIKYETEIRSQAFDVTIIRPGLVFCDQPRGIIGAINRLIDLSKIIPLVGQGDQCFFPCHIEDLASLIQHIIAQDATSALPILAASTQPIMFKDIIKELARAKQKSIHLLPFPYGFLYAGLKLVELLHIKIGLRSDSLKYMKYANHHIEDSAERIHSIPFRAFNIETARG